MLIPVVQAFMIGIFFFRETEELRYDSEDNIIVQPVRMYFDFGIKFLCCFLMHLIVKPDLK